MLWLVYWIWIVFSRGVMVEFGHANLKVSQKVAKTRPASS